MGTNSCFKEMCKGKYFIKHSHYKNEHMWNWTCKRGKTIVTSNPLRTTINFLSNFRLAFGCGCCFPIVSIWHIWNCVYCLKCLFHMFLKVDHMVNSYFSFLWFQFLGNEDGHCGILGDSACLGGWAGEESFLCPVSQPCKKCQHC